MKTFFQNLRNPKMLKPLLALLVVLLVGGGYLFYTFTAGRVFIDNSLVDAPITSIVPANSGTLNELDVYEGENIKRGDKLAVVGGQTLYTDADGLVVMANNQIGSLADTTTPVVQLINLQDMRIAGTIDENKGLSSIRVGQIASFTIDALPGQTFWGYVDEISPTAKQTQISFNISDERPTQQFVVYVKFDASKYPAIRNGMSAKLIVFTNIN